MQNKSAHRKHGNITIALGQIHFSAVPSDKNLIDPYFKLSNNDQACWKHRYN